MFLVVLYTLLGLVGPYLMGVAIDRFIGGKDAAGLVRDCPDDAGSFTWPTTCSRWSPTGSWRASRSERSNNCARDLFQHLQTLSLGFFDTAPGRAN